MAEFVKLLPTARHPLASKGMPRPTVRSAAAKTCEKRKNGIISPQEAAELAKDPNYVDSGHNTIDNTAFRTSSGMTLQDLPYISSAGLNVFVSNAPMAGTVRDGPQAPEVKKATLQEAKAKDQQTFLTNRKQGRDNADLLHPDHAPHQPSISTERRNRLGLTKKAKIARSMVAGTKVLSHYFQTPAHRELHTEPAASNSPLKTQLNNNSGAENDIEMEILKESDEGSGVLHALLGLSDTVIEGLSLPNDSVNPFPIVSPNPAAPESSMPSSTTSELLLHKRLHIPSLNHKSFPMPSSSDSPDTNNKNPSAKSTASPSLAANRNIPAPRIDSGSESDSEDSDYKQGSDSESGSDSDDSDDDSKDHEAVYKELERLIDVHTKRLRTKKMMLEDSSAPLKIVELETLRRYAKARIELQRKLQAKKQNIASAPANLQHVLCKGIPLRWSRPAKTASLEVADCLGKGPYYAKHLRLSAHHLFKTGLILETNQGKGATHASFLNRLEVRKSVRKWARGQVSEEDGGFKGRLRPAKLVRYVNKFLFPKLGIESEICLSTAVNWLNKVGFKLRKVMKGVYVDGHEREDVVASRKEFIHIFETEIFPYCCMYSGESLEIEHPPVLNIGDKTHRVIFQDECCCHANDQCNHVWQEEGVQPLRDKSRGRIVHTSDFVLEASGYLKLTPEEIAVQMKLPEEPCPPSAADSENSASTTKGKGKAKGKKMKKTAGEGHGTQQQPDWIPSPPPLGASYRIRSFEARRIIYPGANYDPWWDMKQLIAQVKDAIQIFVVKFPRDIAVFVFDCSSAHESFSEDALCANKMNRSPAGAQTKMHDTIIPSGPFATQVQKMVFPMDSTKVDSGGKSLAGEAKGMERVLEERGLLAPLKQKYKGKFVGVCKGCKKSQEAKDKAAKEAKEKRDEIEGSGIELGDDRHECGEVSNANFDRSKDCCMRRVLELQEDFAKEKPLLQIIIEEAGHKCFFLPKFHCELNPIEMVWGQTKHIFREETNGSFAMAKQLVPKALNSITISNIRCYFQHCYRYMDAYGKHSLNIRQAKYVVKKYSSHRRIPATIVMDPRILSM